MEKNNVSINKKMAEQIKKIEITGDIIVPEAKPDIVNIINTNCNPYIYKEDCQDGKYRFDGNVDTHIIYLSDSGETKCINATLDFMDFIEKKEINDQMSTRYKIEISKIETKVLNERKINVCITLKISFCFFALKEIEYLDNLNSLTGVEKLQETVELNTVVAQNKIKSSLKEDIVIEENEEIVEILKNDVFVDNCENKISYNKVLSKADVNIRIMYMTQSSKISIFNTTIPIMNFIDMEKVTDENECNTEYKIRNMMFKVEKESKSVSCQIDFEVACEVYKKKSIDIIQDMYGIDRNITFNQKSIEVQTTSEVSKEVVSISEKVLIEDIRAIYDVDCRANIINKINSGNVYNYEGELSLDIYFDTGNNLGVKNAQFPFVVKFENDTDDIDIKFSKKQFKLNNENVLCNVDMEIKPNSNNYKTINLIDDIQEEEFQYDNDYAMVVYFVKDGDTIWNIARDFKVTMDSIIKNNNLQDKSKVYAGEKLYIVK